jgi:hypothetical protein
MPAKGILFLRVMYFPTPEAVASAADLDSSQNQTGLTGVLNMMVKFRHERSRNVEIG